MINRAITPEPRTVGPEIHNFDKRLDTACYNHVNI